MTGEINGEAVGRIHNSFDSTLVWLLYFFASKSTENVGAYVCR